MENMQIHLLSDGLSELSPRESDAYIYANWNQHGTGLFSILPASFALVLHFPAQNKWLLARDRFGIEPLYYSFDTKQQLRFSQDIRDLRGASPVLNPQKIFDYLDPQHPRSYSNSTFYSTVFSVLPGHYLEIEGDRIHTKPYWRPSIKPFEPQRLPTYFEEFRFLLKQSLDRVSRPYARMGAQLSGGVDSSSLVSLFRNHTPLDAFYMDAGVSGDKDPYHVQQVVQSRPKVKLHVLYPAHDNYSSLWQLSALTGVPEQFILPASFHVPIAQKAQDLRCQAILTGHDGDTVVGHGRRELDRMWEREDWTALARSLENMADGLEQWGRHLDWPSTRPARRLELYQRHFFHQKLAQKVKKGEIQGLIRALRSIKREFGYVPYLFFADLLKNFLARVRPNPFTTLLLPHAEIPALNFMDSEALYENLDGEEQLRAVTSRHNIYINEELFALGKHHGLKYLFPFFDKDLLELSLSLPDAIKFNRGNSRYLLKKALEKDLPAALLQRRGKTDFSPYVLRSCIDLWTNNREKILENAGLWQYVDQQTFLAATRFLVNPSVSLAERTAMAHRLNKIMYLGIWLSSLK